jgi:hypothetical protein
MNAGMFWIGDAALPSALSSLDVHLGMTATRKAFHAPQSSNDLRPWADLCKPSSFERKSI